jgi:O-antigen/teichoic acid export membrane protein
MREVSMHDRNYLLKVVGLTGIPKLATIALSLTTLPIVLRSVGAAEYGTVLYVGSALSICEVLIDFGVPSAVGRCLAELRVSRPWALRPEIFAWARLQALFLAGGFLPMLLVAHFVLATGHTAITASLFAVVSATLGLNVLLNFSRPCLQSLLAFHSMSVLDTGQSVLRSLAMLAAAQFMPNALGLAIAGLATSAVAAALAMLLLVQRLRKQWSSNDDHTPMTTPHDRLRASGAFLWLRISSRLFLEMPLLLIGRFLGPDLVGIIGAFLRVNEILNTPYLIVGNALMVRVNEINERGRQAMASMWEVALRIASTAICIAALFSLAAPLIVKVLLPRAVEAPQAFYILAPLIFTTSLSGVLAPMSDYLGALTRRNAVLSVMALLQVPVLMLSINLWGDIGALGSYVVSQLMLAIAYFLLAHRIFFGASGRFVRREVIAFSLCCAVALVLTIFADQILVAWLQTHTSLPSSWFEFVPLVIFTVILGFGLRSRSSWWCYYLRSDFLDFTR